MIDFHTHTPAWRTATWLGGAAFGADEFVGFMDSAGIEQAVVVFVTFLGLFSLLWGYRRHRALRALALLVPGLALLWAGLLHAELHHSRVPHALVMTVGGVLVGLAHLMNLRLNHRHVHDASCAH